MDALMNLTASQLKALWEQKKQEEKNRGNARFNQMVEECKKEIERVIEETDDEVAFVDVVREIAIQAGIALKVKTKRKGKSTGVSREKGNRTVNGYMCILNEERRKYKLSGRKEPTTKTADFVLTKVMGAKWKELKDQGVKNQQLQIDYQAWKEEDPINPKTASPIFINWWKKYGSKGIDVSSTYKTTDDFDTTVIMEDGRLATEETVDIDMISPESSRTTTDSEEAKVEKKKKKKRPKTAEELKAKAERREARKKAWEAEEAKKAKAKAEEAKAEEDEDDYSLGLED